MSASISVLQKSVVRSRPRILMMIAAFGVMYVVLGARMAWLAKQDVASGTPRAIPPSVARPDIVDQTGQTLAMDIPSVSVFAEPRRMLDLDEAVEGLVSVFPDLDMADLRRRLDSDSGFAWIKRVATPAQRERVMALGIPGIGFRDETRRIYATGKTGSHLLGTVNVDNFGIAGIERWIDAQGLNDLKQSGMVFDRRDLDTVQLSMDLRVQHALTDELGKAVQKYGAIAAAGLVMDVTNGEIIALASLPDFDPNAPGDALKPDRINRVNVGTFEMGSTFKAMTTAMALDSGRFSLLSVVDASQPLRFGKMAIRDFRGQNRPLNVPEAFIHSSNIAMGRMAMAVGIEEHQAFLRSLGQFERLTTELPESAPPILPRRWGELTTATASFGHGIAVTPLQAATGIAALVNGGTLLRPTVLKGTPVEPRVLRRDVVSPQTGEALRFLMRLNAEVGSAKAAEIEGYFIGGKTGTSEKVVNGRYSSEKVMTAFMGVVPADKPKYLFMSVIDEPKGLPETYGFRTSGWNAVPVTGAIMRRTLPMLLAPYRERPGNPFPMTVSTGAWGTERFMSTTTGGGLAAVDLARQDTQR